MFTQTVVALALVAQSSPMVKAQWKSFSPARGNFRVLMPSEPKERRTTIQTSDGERDLTIYSASHGDTTYVVSYYDRPISAPKVEPEVVLDRARETFVSNLQGKVLKRKKLELGGNKGCELQVDAPVSNSKARLDIYARLFVIDKRVFEVKTLAYKKPEGTKTSNDSFFLTSFKLPEGGGAVVVEEEKNEPGEKKTSATAKAESAKPESAKAEAAKPAAGSSSKTAERSATKKGSASAKGTKIEAGEKKLTKGLKGALGFFGGSSKKSAAGGGAAGGGPAAGSPLAGFLANSPLGGLMGGPKPPGLGGAPVAPPSTPVNVPPGFKLFTSEEFGFSALMPGEPEKKPEESGTLFKVRASQNDFYSVAVIKTLPKESKPEDYYTSFITRVVKSVKGTLLSRRPIQLGDRQGVEYFVKYMHPSGNEMRGKQRIFLVNGITYSIGVYSPELEAIAKNVDTFMDSFTIKGVGGGLEGGNPLASTSSPTSAPAPDDFKPFTSDKFGFTVLMPGEPKTVPKDIPNPVQKIVGGPAKLKTISFICQREKVTYVVRVVYNPRPVPDEKAENYFKGMMRIAQENGKGKILTEHAIKLGDVPGYEFTSEFVRPATKEPAIAHTRCFLMHDKTYMVHVIAPDQETAEKTNNFFFDSFQFKAKGDKAASNAPGNDRNAATQGKKNGGAIQNAQP